ncbi:MAG: SDR family oxidoreductase [Solirubrobacteraceae bacterium]
MDLGIQGRVAIVGGATAGIGRAIAVALVAEGARVVVSSRDPDRTSATATEIGAAGAVAWDTHDVAGADHLVDEVEATVGPPEIVVVNTGGPPTGDPLEIADEQWDDAHRHLVRSPMALLRRVLPGMQQRGWGRVVNVMSSSVREPMPHLVLSNAERSAALAAFKTLAGRVAGDGVTLNCLLPGRIATDRLAVTHGSLEQAEAQARTNVPAGRLGRPEEMAAAAAFLCSEQAAYITGAALPVDGGLLRGI